MKLLKSLIATAATARASRDAACSAAPSLECGTSGRSG